LYRLKLQASSNCQGREPQAAGRRIHRASVIAWRLITLTNGYLKREVIMTQSNETSRQPKDEDSDLTRNESRLVNHRILAVKARRQKLLHPRRSFIPRTVFREVSAVFSVTYTQRGSFALISHLITIEAVVLLSSLPFSVFFPFFFFSDIKSTYSHSQNCLQAWLWLRDRSRFIN